jgi:hypothetical protein
MINMGQRWMAKLLMWVSGNKHPETDAVVFKNVWEYDRIRKILKRRCTVCDYVLSSDEKNIREVPMYCEEPKCSCRSYTYGPTAHPVCMACYDIWQSLYGNDGLKNYNYFKYAHEAWKAEMRDPKRKDRLGL